jgi:hypothetical protein
MRNIVKPVLIAGSAKTASMLAVAAQILLITAFPAPAEVPGQRPIGAITSLADAGQIGGKTSMSTEESVSQAIAPGDRAGRTMAHNPGLDNDAGVAVESRHDPKQQSRLGDAVRGTAAGAIASSKAPLRRKQSVELSGKGSRKPDATRLHHLEAKYARLVASLRPRTR